MVYNKADFKKHIETIQIEGFKLKSAVQAYLFIRKQNDRTETITISYRNYAPHGFYVDGVSADIYFNEVEQVLEKNELQQEYKSTFGKSFQNEKGINYDKLAAEINSNESFEIVKSIIVEIIAKNVVPFFNNFSNLREVADFLAYKDVEEIVPYIQGGILLPKTVLILKMTEHPNFLEKLIDFRNILLKYSLSNMKYQILLKKYENLFELDLMKIN